ncbi:MAG: SMC family ATPase [Bryobacteraceae bacterium]
MILKSLTLEGIRSYRDETPINLPTGTTLFEGDIASGKSTILYAIEFALFGLGSLGGTFLLRNGVREGSVSIVFDVDGKEYEVHRGLERKGRGISQTGCYIIGPDGKAILSATELRERILQLLKFNEPPNPRAQSVIYRYAVFTPQEEMKEVILKDADERLQTLRRAFGIEQYKVAVQNATTTVSAIKGRMDYLQGATEDIEDVRNRLAREVQNEKTLSESIKPLRSKERELDLQRKARKAELKKLEAAREKIKRAEEKVPLLDDALSGKVDERDELIRENEKLRKKIDVEIEPQLTKLKVLKKPTTKSKDELKKELRDNRSKKEEAESLKSRLVERIENFDSILETNVCPVCERKIEHKDFSAKSRHLKEEKVSKEKEIKAFGEAVEELEDLVDQLRDYESAQKDLKSLSSTLDDLRERVEENEKRVKQLGPVISDLEKQLQAAKEEMKPLEDLLRQIKDVEEGVENLDEDYSDIGKKIAGILEQVRSASESKEQLEKDLLTITRQLKAKESLGEHKIWITDYLSPTIENIEKHVLNSLNQRFNAQFQKWFLILMEDPDLLVRVDEEFSPVIEREGYEQDFLALSGGEKTSVALAYRLALNTLVQEVAAGGGTNVLILDEPTDGFSKEQLSKVRDVLAELKCPQVILVSHERELEAFADQIYRVEKVNGESRITPGR